jgi:hypothetical protein
MSITIRQAEETWFVKLYHETWQIPKKQFERVMGHFPANAVASVKNDFEHYLVRLPEDEINCGDETHLLEALKELIELKNKYGKLGKPNQTEGEIECR